MKSKASVVLALVASMLGAGMVAGIESAHREVQKRDADDRDRQRIEDAEAKRERKRAKRRLTAGDTKGDAHGR